ncbi:MAG: hypothetical protein II139_09805 [Lachnospiraceae bacterium]|nr:hypothetical protein [Lachnospiraceae bacterium]
MAEKCKRCLLYEMAGSKEVYESVLRLIADMDPSERASKEECTRRLGVCKACDHLLDGMCRACGCYVELRAAGVERSCPYEKW